MIIEYQKFALFRLPCIYKFGGIVMCRERPIFNRYWNWNVILRS